MAAGYRIEPVLNESKRTREIALKENERAKRFCRIHDLSQRLTPDKTAERIRKTTWKRVNRIRKIVSVFFVKDSLYLSTFCQAALPYSQRLVLNTSICFRLRLRYIPDWGDRAYSSETCDTNQGKVRREQEIDDGFVEKFEGQEECTESDRCNLVEVSADLVEGNRQTTGNSQASEEVIVSSSSSSSSSES